MKIYSLRTIVMIFAIALILFSCAKKKTTEEAGNASQFLPEKVLSAGLERAPGIRIFSGDSLWEYIDGGAELYHQYNFAEVAIAEYKGDKVELVADIYRFDNATDAYGIYSILRPEKPNIVIMGVEGFSASAAIVFVKGAYLVKVFAYEDSESSNKAMVGLAQELNNQIPGASNRPNSFLLFPVNNRIGARDKYFRESFLGQKFLRRFYTQEYLFGADTVTLFLSHDEAGEKYLKWSEYAVSLNRLEPASDSLGYDSAKAFIINDNLSGLSIAGLKKGKLIGMLKYNDTHRQFLVDWVNSFQ